MNILEKEIEDLIWHGIQNDRPALHQRGLYISDRFHYIRQLDLGSYGRLDIAGFCIGKKQDGMRRIYLHVLEIKKDLIGVGTLLQAIRYCNGLRRIVEDHLKSTYIDFRIDLIGKTIETNSDFIYAASILEGLHFLTYTVDFYKGIKFEHHRNYSLKNEVLPDVTDLGLVIKNHIAKRLQWEKEMEF